MCNKIFCPETYAGLCNHIFWRYVDLQGVGTLPNPHVDAKIQNSGGERGAFSPRVTLSSPLDLRKVNVNNDETSMGHEGTAATKINRPGHNIRMYWTNFRQPTAHV